MEATYGVVKYLKVTNYDLMKCVFSLALTFITMAWKPGLSLESPDPSDVEKEAALIPAWPTHPDGLVYTQAPLSPWPCRVLLLGSPKAGPSSRGSVAVLAAYSLSWDCEPCTPRLPLPGLWALWEPLLSQLIDTGILISDLPVGWVF